MTAIKDKLVTVESIGALHEYNLQRVIDVAHGGTGATDADTARANIGAAASHKIGREVEGQQSFVESNAVNVLTDLVPYVSIVAKDTTSDSTGAKIQVSDHTNEDLGEAGLIQMKAQKAEIEVNNIKINDAEIISVNKYDGALCDVDITGNASIGSIKDDSGNITGGDLSVGGNITVNGTAQFNDTLHIQDEGVYVCDLNMNDNAHAFGLVDGKLEIGLDGKAKGLFDTNINGNNVSINGNSVNIVADNKIVPNVPVFSYAATFSVPETQKLTKVSKAIQWILFTWTNSKYFECVSSPYLGVKCKRTGAILISSTLLITDTTKGCQYYACFVKNGEEIVGQARESLPADNAIATLNMTSSVMNVNAGDIIGIVASNENADTGSIIKGAGSRMNIMYLS